MDIHPIKTDQDHSLVLREIETLMSAEPGTQEGDRLDVLVALVEAWECRHHALALPDIQPSGRPAAA